MATRESPIDGRQRVLSGAAAAVPSQASGSTLRASFLLEGKASALDEVLRYGLAAVLVLGTAVALAFAVVHGEADEPSAEVQQAVLLDLPAAEASAQPPSTEPEGPPQAASAAQYAQQTPEREPAETDPQQQKAEQPPLPTPVAPDPAAIAKVEAKPSVTPAAQASQAQEARAPADSAALPTPDKHDTGDESRARPARHAISLWQRSLLRRLEAAKRLLGRGPHARGSVSVAFTIDDTGALRSVRVAATSGSEALDREATTLVRRAAPFPVPPPGSDEHALSFQVPILFR